MLAVASGAALTPFTLTLLDACAPRPSRTTTVALKALIAVTRQLAFAPLPPLAQPPHSYVMRSPSGSLASAVTSTSQGSPGRG